MSPNWKLLALATGVLAACSLAASAAAPAAPTAGPCLPPGVPVPPGVKIPRCPKPGPASNLRVKVDGSVTVAFAVHSQYWGECNAAHGGGSHTDASTVLNFGTPTADPATATYRTEATNKKKVLSTLTAEPQIQATMNPKQDQRHEVAPGCGVVKDPTNCTQSKGQGGATVHLSERASLAKVTVRPPAAFPTQCIAPFTGNSTFENLVFQHELDEVDGGKLGLVSSPTSSIKLVTIEWEAPQKPCSAYGITKPVLIGGTIEKCTIEGDFRIVVTRVSQPKR